MQISDDVRDLSNHELIELYNIVVDHINYLSNNIINIEEEIDDEIGGEDNAES